MDHSLIYTIVFCIVAAFAFGLIAKKLNLPTIVGYLVAGMVVGPYTPGFTADITLAKQLAEIGIILLMFGVGLHFSFKDLLKVKGIAIPGALFQMLISTVIGMWFVMYIGFDMITGLVFGFSLSVASTIVLLRTFEQRGLLQTEGGKIAVGWLIVEDLAMVLVLVFLPVLASFAQETHAPISWIEASKDIGIATLKIGLFFVFMVYVGKHILSWILTQLDHIDSQELSTLGTLSVAMGFAIVGYALFGASFALGAFLTGLVVNENQMENQEETSQMRNTFAVLFFVSVGMMFNPNVIFTHPGLVIVTFLIIVVGKALAALLVARLFKQPWGISLMIAYSLAQIGEFSFILAGMAMAEGVMPDMLYNLVLAGALLSIAVNPLLFKLMDISTDKTMPAVLKFKKGHA